MKETKETTERTRDQIGAEVKARMAEIRKLEKQTDTLREEVFELLKEGVKISDEKQWYKEAEEDVQRSLRGKPEKLIVGRVYWKERFKDEDSGEPFEVERSRIVWNGKEWNLVCPWTNSVLNQVD